MAAARAAAACLGLRAFPTEPYYRPGMQTARAEIARERRRMVQVRQAFMAGLDSAAAWNGREPAGFYCACADYLGFSMGRLYAQDGLIHDLLLQRIPASDTAAREELALLAEEQSRGRVLVEKLSRAARALRDSGGGTTPAFEAVASEFVAGFGSSLRARRNPFARYTEELFSDADWERIAGVTPASTAEESRLFAGVRHTAPSGVDPEQFSAVHGPG
jgi:hypothetical protein